MSQLGDFNGKYIILSYIYNSISYLCGDYDSQIVDGCFIERKNLYFGVNLDGHVMFKIYEESGYSLDLDLLTILY
jgi:hypothetical protein